MADRNVGTTPEEVPDIPELVEQVLLYSLDEGKEKLISAGEVVPFTALVVKNNLFIETHPAGSPELCFADAERTIAGARGASAYAFCYDGYVDTDDGQKDVLIAEGGLPGEPVGYAVGYVYAQSEDGVYEFEEEAAYIGEAPNFMNGLKDSLAYDDAEIDERYLEAEELVPEESDAPVEGLEGEAPAEAKEVAE